MDTPLLKTIALLSLPAIAFFGGAWVLLKMSGRQQVPQKPLNRRFGYDLRAVQHYWGAFDDAGRRAERHLLELDLAFPILYGGALAASLLMAWSSLDERHSLAWILAPLAITLLADWTENFVQLGQLERYVAQGPTALQQGWIRLASTATVLKLSFFYASWSLLFYLVFRLWTT